jgi:hypothetical protein
VAHLTARTNKSCGRPSGSEALQGGAPSEEAAGTTSRTAALGCPDLSDADLFQADLVGANLISADLYGAVLTEADLSGADLTGATHRFCTAMRLIPIHPARSPHTESDIMLP